MTTRNRPTSLTYFQVAGGVARHFSEAEGRDFAPHAEGGRQAPARVPGADEVSGEGQDPAGTQNNVRKRSSLLKQQLKALEAASDNLVFPFTLKGSKQE